VLIAAAGTVGAINSFSLAGVTLLEIPVRMVIAKDVHFWSELVKAAGVPNEKPPLCNVL